MSQRISGYARKENDHYCTPAWVTEALLPHIDVHRDGLILEPAAGEGHIVDVLKQHFKHVKGNFDRNFLEFPHKLNRYTAIITNPPYGLAEEFIAQALDLTEPSGLVAMLLRTDYDHAATRAYLFERPFAKRIVLRKRIRWIEGSTGSPSFNHSWFVWDWKHKGPPTIAYAP